MPIAETLKTAMATFGAVKSFLVGGGTSDGDTKDSGLQAHIGGKGRADESLYLEALALAKEELLKEEAGGVKKYTRTDVNAMGKRITDLLKAYSAKERLDIILTLGIGEKTITEKEPSGKDKDGKTIFKEKTYAVNLRGVHILKNWLTMTAEEIRSEISSLVNGTQVMDEQWNALMGKVEKFNVTMRDPNNPLPQRESLGSKRQRNGKNPFSTLFGRKK